MAPAYIKTAEAFCPAHITGFFKAHTTDVVISKYDKDRDDEICNNIDESRLYMGSTGAGFSLEAGVTTRVSIHTDRHHTQYNKGANKVTENNYPHIVITTSGAHAITTTNDTKLSRVVIQKFLKFANMWGDTSDSILYDAASKITIHVNHTIQVPVGYGLGCSGAAALSLAYALDEALSTKMGKTAAAKIAHISEIECGTGLGDVLASYHGGFEVRTSPGAPGIGMVKNIATDTDAAVTVMCMAPMPTNKLIKKDLTKAGMLGEEMIQNLVKSKDYQHFQKMSLEFAECVEVITPKMRSVIDELQSAGIGCGVALFGETIFCITDKKSDYTSRMRAMHEAFQKYPKCVVLNSKFDQNGGARRLLPMTMMPAAATAAAAKTHHKGPID